MGMTKAERARMQELETALAMHWPAYPQPQPMPREEIKAEAVDLDLPQSWKRTGVRGWFFNDHTGELSEGWSDGTSHCRHGPNSTSAAQGVGQIYRTRTDAAMALRITMTKTFAARLASVDRIILGAA